MVARSQFSPIEPAARHQLEQVRLEPALRLSDGRTISNAAEAVDLVRAHETRPGVDDRYEVLHALERAQSHDEKVQAVKRFRAWASVWGEVPVSTTAGRSAGQQERATKP
jgi:hypothetical protein